MPPLTTPDTASQGNQIARGRLAGDAADRHGPALDAELMPLPPNQKDYYSYPEVTAPTFSKWRAAGAKVLVTGFVQSRPDGRLTVRLLRL